MSFYKNIILTVKITSLSVVIFTSCGSHEQKGDDAFERVKQERKLSNDSGDRVNNAMVIETKKSESVTKKENPDERAQYKIDTDKKIQKNEMKINEMKAKPYTNAGLSRQVTNLENDNKDLTIRMNKYNKEEKVKWELFKATMNQNVNDIGLELKEIKTNNKKLKAFK